MMRSTIIALAAAVLAACSGISTQCSADDLCNTVFRDANGGTVWHTAVLHMRSTPTKPIAVLGDSQQHPAVDVLSSVIRAAGTLGGGLAIGRGMSDIKLF